MFYTIYIKIFELIFTVYFASVFPSHNILRFEIPNSMY